MIAKPRFIQFRQKVIGGRLFRKEKERKKMRKKARERKKAIERDRKIASKRD